MRPSGSSPLVGSSRKMSCRSSHQTHGNVKPAAHPARIGGNPAVGGVGQTEAVQQSIRDLTRIVKCRSLAINDQIFLARSRSRPPRRIARSGLIDWRTASGFGRNVEAVDGGVPLSCLSSVVRILIIVVLPAPLSRAGRKYCLFPPQNPRLSEHEVACRTFVVLSPGIAWLSIFIPPIN